MRPTAPPGGQWVSSTGPVPALLQAGWLQGRRAVGLRTLGLWPSRLERLPQHPPTPFPQAWKGQGWATAVLTSHHVGLGAPRTGPCVYRMGSRDDPCPQGAPRSMEVGATCPRDQGLRPDLVGDRRLGSPVHLVSPEQPRGVGQ